MTIKVLNLRSFISGQQPVSLEGGELCFNMTDRTLFVGNQSDSKTDFDGNSSSGVPGQGWFSMPMDAAGFGEYFLTSPDVYGQSPNNGDTLEWNSLLGHLEWVPGGGGGGGGSSAGYLTTNSDVVAAPGVNITAKLNYIISPSVALSGNTAIVQGVSGDLYEGVYTFVDGAWEFGSFYAQPVAAAIVYDNAVSGLSSGDVQGAIDELAAGKVNTPLTPPLTNQVLGWNGTATEWTNSSGGSVAGVYGTTPIVVDNSDPNNPVVEVSAASIFSPGVVQLNDTTTSTSTTEAATANAVKTAYDLANTAEADAQQALADAAAAFAIANTAEVDAQLALSEAAVAQSDATLAIGLANTAEADAQQALTDAAAAQATADLALPSTGGVMSGIINFAGTQPTATILAANIVQLLDSTSSNSITTAATPNSVRAAYTLANGALPKIGGVMTGDITFNSTQQFPISGIQPGSTTQSGVVQLLSSVSSVSQSYAATPYAVKLAYDAAVTAQTTANAALSRAGGTMTGNIVFAPTQTFPSSSVADATTTSKGVVQIGTNIEVSSGIISVLDGNTTNKGVVQLTDALNSTSTTLGLTANGGYLLQQQIDTLSLLSNLTFCGTINASTGLLTSVTDAGIVHGFTVGLPLPSPGLVTNDHFVVVSIPGTFTPTGGSGPIVCNQGDWIVGTEPTPAAYEWSLQPVGYDAPSATTTIEGVTYLATNLEVQTGVDTSNKAVNPASLQSKLSDSISLTSSTTIASSTAVKEAYDLADAAIPDSVFDAVGDMVVATGADTYTRLAVGADGYILAANSGQVTGMEWVPSPTGPGSAQPDVEGLVYGLTANSVSGYNVSLGYGANGTLTSGVGNVAIGGASGDVTSGSYNVAIGFDTSVADPASDKQLAIGPDAYTRWLTGDSSMNVKLGAGLVDATNLTGTSGQILSSTGTAIQWINNAPSGVLSVTGTAPVSVNNTDPQNPVVSVAVGSTAAEGVLRLTNSFVSTSITTAATPNSVFSVYQIADAALPKAGGTMSGDLRLLATLADSTNSPGTNGYILKSTGVGIRWVASAPGNLVSVSGDAPITVNNANPVSPIIGVNTGSTTATGVLQLTNSVSSTSTSTAATPSSVKTAYDLANAAIPGSVFNTKGDIVVGSGNDTYGNLPSGTNGQVLVADSAETFGVKWTNNTPDGVSGVTGTAPITVDNTDTQNPIVGVDDATTLAKGVVQIGSNIDVTSGTISVASGSTSVVGVLQLTDSVSSTSTTTAATPNSVKTAYDLANNAVPDASYTAAGDLLVGSGAGTYTALPAGAADYILASNGVGGLTWVAQPEGGVTGVTGTAPITVNNTDPQNPVISVNTGTASGLGALQVGTNIDVAAGVISVKTANLTDLGLVRVGTNIDVAAGVISVADASTSTKGVVQLNNTTNNTSTSLALTAAQGKNLQDQIDALAVSGNITLAGTYNASTGLVDSVTAAGTTAGFVVGNALPSPTAGNANYFVIVDVQGSTGPSGTPPYHIGDWFLSDGTTWQFLNVGFQASAATTTNEGVVYLATDAEVQAGTDTSNKAVNPASLQSKVSDSVSTTDSYSIASSTAVKTAYDLANAAIPKAVYDAKGDLIIGTGSDTYSRLGVGTNNQVLKADSAQATGLKWAFGGVQSVMTDVGGPIQVNNTDPANPVLSIVTASISSVGVTQLTNSTASTSTTTAAVPASVKAAYDFAASKVAGPTVSQTTGQSLVVNSPSGGTTSWAWRVAYLDSTGAITIGGTPLVPVIGVATASTPLSGAIGATSGVVTLSDLLSTNLNYAATVNLVNNVNVNADTKLPKSVYTAKGDLVVGTGSTTYSPVTVGTDGQVLIADSASASGVSWNTAAYPSPATTTSQGIVQLATDAEVQAGTDTANAVVSSSLQSKLSDSISTTSSITIASSTAVKTAYDLADAAIPDSTFTAAGELIVGTGAGTYTPLSDGSANQILATDGAGVLSWVNNTVDGVQGITGTAPITIDNTDPANPIVEIDAATTSISGAVQLYDDVDSTSTSLAATANAVKIAYDAAIADPMASATVLFVNTTTGNNATGTRGTGLPYQTVTAALAAASEGDTLYIAPGSYSESITLGKGVNIVGTYTDQTTACGPTFTGAFSVSISGAGSQNWAVTNVRFMGASAGTNTVTVSNNSFSSGGIGTFTNCFFEQFTAGSLTERCFITSGTWTKSLYMRNCSFSNNIEFASGAVNGTGSYVVVDNFYGTASVGDVFKIVSGTVEFRNPSQAMPPVLQTGGTFVATNINSWLINSSATTSIFGGTGFSYKGTSVGLGSSAVYLVGQGNSVVEGVTWGKLSVGSNVIYGFNNVLYDTSLATLSGVPLNTVAPNANASVITQTRPQWQYLTTSSTVTAANQFGVALENTTGKVYTVTYYDAGEY